MTTKNIWGPHYWFFVSISLKLSELNLHEKTKVKITRFFFHSLQHTYYLVSVCRKHLRSNLKVYPIRLNSKRELVEWLLDLHNEVNALTGKSE